MKIKLSLFISQMMVVENSDDSLNDNNKNSSSTSRKSPLLTTDKSNGVVANRRPKSREVSSRYMSPSPSSATSSHSSSISSKRIPSPLISRPLPNSTPSNSLSKRSQSAERRRPVTPKQITPLFDSKPTNSNELSAATKLLVTSTRSLSVSFQGEAFALPISKTKVAPPPNERKTTPERRRITPLRGKIDGDKDHVENSKPTDHQRWPGRIRQTSQLSKSLCLDNGPDKKNLIGSERVIRVLQRSMMDEGRSDALDARLGLSDSAELALDPNLGNESLVPSDTDSVSSGSTSGGGGATSVRSGSRGIAVSARFWQETNSRLRRLQDPGSPLSPVSKMTTPRKPITSKRFPTENPISSSRTMGSPIRGANRAASPSKLFPSPSGTNLSGGNISSSSTDTPSILSFGVDVRRGKMGGSRIVEAHYLRLLYNRHLQWRFINARAESGLLIQKLSAEKKLWNAWISISELRDSVTIKRIKLQLLRRRLKLTSILRGQMSYLEEWAHLDRDHSSSLVGAIEALKASTLRLPLVGGATADIQSLMDAVASAVGVMHAMASSLCSHLSKVEEVNSLVAELATVTAKEQAVLDQFKDIVSAIAAMQIKESSLRTNMIQLIHTPTTLTTPV